MMQKLKIKFFLCSLAFLALTAQAQTKNYSYKRDIKGITSNWHSLQLPNQIFSKTQTGLEDLRIFGFKGKDTIEVPYILEQSADQITEKESPFNIINQSSSASAFYYTFQAAAAATINQIKLSFKQTNFDWKIILEGSNNNSEWFTLLKDYRILSIKNDHTDYRFTDLNFPTAKYTYFRLSIQSKIQPTLAAAKILKTDTLKGLEKEIAIKSYRLNNNAKTKQSIMEISLTELTPVSYFKLNAQNSLDFYRNLTIEYATDSIKTDKGIQYNYAPLYEGTITSLELPEFHIKSTLLSRLRITIENNDNQPLRLNSVRLKGPIYELVARFAQTDYQYALYYGNSEAVAPIYELKNFENKIPISLSTLIISEEQKNPTFSVKITKPLFENKVWLWALMGIIISILGFFAYKMLKEK